MVVGRINGVVGLTGFSDKKMTGCLVGTKKCGHINEVVVRRGSLLLKSSFRPICLSVPYI